MKNMAYVAALIVAAGCSLLIAVTTLPANYKCGDASKDHCYANVTWEERPQYFGAYTDITQVAMSCPSDCGGFVDDEIWLNDTNSPDCKTNGMATDRTAGVCWVEAGTIMEAGMDGRHFFWADARPLKTNTFNLHILGPGDAEGVVNHYMIIQDARGDFGIVSGLGQLPRRTWSPYREGKFNRVSKTYFWDLFVDGIPPWEVAKLCRNVVAAQDRPDTTKRVKRA